MQNSGGFGQTLVNTLDQLGSSSPVGAITLALPETPPRRPPSTTTSPPRTSSFANDTAHITTDLNNANEALQAIPQQLNEVNELYSAMTGYNTTSTG